VIVALAFLNIPFFLRITRGTVLQVRSRTFVEAAICAGNTEMRAAFFHVMPNPWPRPWSTSRPRSASRSCPPRA
jgi:ABC-type dipeptide/oligopeptide/nickel transport system permease subunit